MSSAVASASVSVLPAPWHSDRSWLYAMSRFPLWTYPCSLRCSTFLEDLQKEFGLTYLFIAHDLSVVEYISDRVSRDVSGKAVGGGRHRDSVRQPQAPIHPGVAVCHPNSGSDAQEAAHRPDKATYPARSTLPAAAGSGRRCWLAQAICAEQEPKLREVDRATGQPATSPSLRIMTGGRLNRARHRIGRSALVFVPTAAVFASVGLTLLAAYARETTASISLLLEPSALLVSLHSTQRRAPGTGGIFLMSTEMDNWCIADCLGGGKFRRTQVVDANGVMDSTPSMAENRGLTLGVWVESHVNGNETLRAALLGDQQIRLITGLPVYGWLNTGSDSRTARKLRCPSSLGKEEAP